MLWGMNYANPIKMPYPKLLIDKRSKAILTIVLIVGFLFLLFVPFLVSAGILDDLFGGDGGITEISDKDFNSEKYQKIETDYITFELPKIATHYWGTDENLDTYEVIISNFSIKNNSDYVLKFTWQDERYINENFQIHYDFKNNELTTDEISYNSLSKYNKTCMDNLDNPLSLSSKDSCLKDSKDDTSKLTFQNMTIKIGTLEGYNYNEEYNETCLYYLKNETNYLRGGLNYSRDNRLNYTERKGECLLKVAYPIYSWTDFNKITTKDIEKDFLAIDDVAVSACGTLNTAGETYNQDQDIDAETAGAGDCIIISNENITFNGNGYWILGE